MAHDKEQPTVARLKMAIDKEQSRRIIRDTFEQPFDKARFTSFIRNLLNHFEDAPFLYQGQYIPDSFKLFIGSYERIGKFTDGDNRIDILIVKLLRTTSLEQARTSQRNFIAGYLQGKYGSSNEKDAALVAFVAPDAANWRFSLVRLDYSFDEKYKPKQDFTPARRWSFLVGAGEKSHTAQSRLVDILADSDRDPTLTKLEEAFNIEKVTTEFFREYRDLFIRTKEALDAVVRNDPQIHNTINRNPIRFTKTQQQRRHLTPEPNMPSHRILPLLLLLLDVAHQKMCQRTVLLVPFAESTMKRKPFQICHIYI